MSHLLAFLSGPRKWYQRALTEQSHFNPSGSESETTSLVVPWKTVEKHMLDSVGGDMDTSEDEMGIMAIADIPLVSVSIFSAQMTQSCVVLVLYSLVIRNILPCLAYRDLCCFVLTDLNPNRTDPGPVKAR